MLIIPGIIASSQYVAKGDYESIATVTVGAGGSSSVEFTSIPSTYKHLQIRGIVKMSNAGQYPLMRLNGSTSTIYNGHLISCDGSTVIAYGYSSGTNTFLDWMCGGGNSSSTGYSAFVTDILDYTNTNKYRTLRSLAGLDLNGSGQVFLASGLFQSTTAISSITMYPSSNTFSEHSHFALYGVKG